MKSARSKIIFYNLLVSIIYFSIICIVTYFVFHRNGLSWKDFIPLFMVVVLCGVLLFFINKINTAPLMAERWEMFFFYIPGVYFFMECLLY